MLNVSSSPVLVLVNLRTSDAGKDTVVIVELNSVGVITVKSPQSGSKVFNVIEMSFF